MYKKTTVHTTKCLEQCLYLTSRCFEINLYIFNQSTKSTKLSNCSTREQYLEVHWLVLTTSTNTIKTSDFISTTHLTTSIREVHITQESPRTLSRNSWNKLKTNSHQSYVQSHRKCRNWNITTTRSLIEECTWIDTSCRTTTTISTVRTTRSGNVTHTKSISWSSIHRTNTRTTTRSTSWNCYRCNTCWCCYCMSTKVSFKHCMCLGIIRYPIQLFIIFNMELLSKHLSPHCFVLIFCNQHVYY